MGIQQIHFTATPAIQLSGNNQNFIYAPSNLHYVGRSFDINAGEQFIIIPYQPADHGPWKIYHSIVVDSELKTFVKNPKIFCIRISNKWMTKSIKLTKNTCLDTLLGNPGIEHSYGTITFDDLIQINENDDVDDDDDDDDDDSKRSKITCVCPCCLK